VAEQAGIPVLRKFFGEALAGQLITEGKQADLIIGNNVYAHVPDINDFTLGIKKLLKPDGTVTLEFPHLLNLVKQVQFDTIYHEHFSYLSLYTVARIFNSVGLRIFNVEKITTHGGSLRVYGCHDDDVRNDSDSVQEILNLEKGFGLQELGIYDSFQDKVDSIKNNLLVFLIEQKKLGNNILAYGAAAKGNTLLNYAGVKKDLLPAVFDAALSKQGKYLPGSHIPIFSPDKIATYSFNAILILPWNIAKEVKESVAHICGSQTSFMIAIPKLEQV